MMLLTDSGHFDCKIHKLPICRLRLAIYEEDEE